MSKDMPCYAADALWRIRQIPINGIMTGITMLDESIAEIQAQNYTNDPEILSALMKKIKMYNYIPRGIEAEYGRALLEEYKNRIAKSNTKKFE